MTSDSRFVLPQPIVSEAAQPSERFPILGAVRGRLAGDDVVGMANGEFVHYNTPSPGVSEPLNAVGGKNQVQVEGTVFQLDEIFAAFNFGRLGICELESQFPQRRRESASIFRRAIGKNIGVLGGVGKAQDDCSGFGGQKSRGFPGPGGIQTRP